MTDSAKDAYEKLIKIFGSALDFSKMPQIWNQSPYTHFYYLKLIRTWINKNDYGDISDGTHLKLVIAPYPIQIAAVPAAGAVAAIDAEDIAVFRNRVHDYEFRHKVDSKSNEEYKNGVTAILNKFETILGEASLKLLEGPIAARNIRQLMINFAAMGTGVSSAISSSVMDALKLAAFPGVLIQNLKAMLDNIFAIADSHKPVGSKISDDEKRNLFIKKVLTIDTSIKEDSLKARLSHVVNNIKSNIGGPYTYEGAFTNLFEVQTLWDAENQNHDIINSAAKIYLGHQASVMQDDKKGSNKDKGNSKGNSNRCIGCNNPNHTIDDCKSTYKCVVNPNIAHKFSGQKACTNPKCKPPAKRLRDYLEYNSNRIQNKVTQSQTNKEGKDNKDKTYATAAAASSMEVENIEPPAKKVKIQSENNSRLNLRMDQLENRAASQELQNLEVMSLMRSMSNDLASMRSNQSNSYRDSNRYDDREYSSRALEGGGFKSGSSQRREKESNGKSKTPAYTLENFNEKIHSRKDSDSD